VASGWLLIPQLNHLIFHDNQINASGVFKCYISLGLPSDGTY